MKNYIDTAMQVIFTGRKAKNRTGVDTKSIFAVSEIEDLTEGFPAVTIKQTFTRGAWVEMCWMLKGLINTDYLHEHNVFFWDQWALEEDYTEERPLSNADRMELYVKAKGLSYPATLREFNAQGVVAGTNILNNAGIPTTKTVVLQKKGALGPVYGAMMRKFPNPDGSFTDQIAELENMLVNNPESRRHVVSLWCPFLLPDESLSPQENVKNGKQALAPCHWMFEVYTEALTKEEQLLILKKNNLDFVGYKFIDDIHICRYPLTSTDDVKVFSEVVEEYNVPKFRLNLHYHMRSSDLPAGKPLNTVFYATLAHLLALHANMVVGKLWHTGTNAHIYEDQLEDMETALKRTPYPLATLRIKTKRDHIWEYEPTDFELVDYQSHPAIKVKVAK